MTRGTAIAVLFDLLISVKWDVEKDAIRMAIEALQQPTGDDIISRTDAIEGLRKDVMGGLNYEYILSTLPSADAVSCKDAEWEITDAYPHNVYCSNCHKKFAQTHWEVWKDGSLPRNFCPNCGADMRGGKNEHR